MALFRRDTIGGQFAGIVKPGSPKIRERGTIGADPAVTSESTCRLGLRVGFLKGSLVDISDGQTPGQGWFGRQSPAIPDPAEPAMSQEGDGSGGSPPDAALGGVSRGAPIHPRLLAMMMAARYFGLELDPVEFRNGPGDTIPGAAALSDWAKNSGMWSRALRLRWRHLMHLSSTGPVVLLFNDGPAGLLTGANPEAKIIALKDPRAPEADPAIMVDELRLAEVWNGETILLRTERGGAEADPPFTIAWLFKMMMQEKKSLSDLLIASLALSFLTIVPPLIVMSIIDKVITHHSFSTLFLMSVILGIMVLYETLLGFARRLVIAGVGVRTDARLNLHVFSTPYPVAAGLFRAPPGRPDDVSGQSNPPRCAELHHRQVDDHLARFDNAGGAAAVCVLA